MAFGRCYTKSGSVKKYESNLWSSPSSDNWSFSGIVGTITTPDSNGNYTVTPAPEYEDSYDPTELYCYTMYGGVRKTFYFKRSIKEILLTCGIGPQEEEDFITIFLASQNNKYLGNDKLDVVVRVMIHNSANNSTIFGDSIYFTVDKNSPPSLYKRIYSHRENINKFYDPKIISCSPMSGNGYKVVIYN